MFGWIRFSLRLHFLKVQKTPLFVELFVEVCSPMVDSCFRRARVKSLGSHPRVQWRPAPSGQRSLLQVEVGDVVHGHWHHSLDPWPRCGC